MFREMSGRAWRLQHAPESKLGHYSDPHLLASGRTPDALFPGYDRFQSEAFKLRNMTEAELVQFGKALRDKWDKFLNADQKKNLIELKEARS